MLHSVAPDATTNDVTILARDGYPLAATVTQPVHGRAEGPVVIIGSATAVPRRYYAAFAQAVAQRGCPVVSFDYRGVGGSAPQPPLTLRRFPHRNRTWGTHDIASVIDWTRETFPGRRLHWVGHSFGGFGFGLADNGHLLARTLNVATPFSYWGQMDGAEKYRIAVLAYLGIPIVTAMTGRLPGVALGGEDLPAPVAREWAQWLRSPNMFFEDPTLPERAHFGAVTADMLFLRITDDPWATDLGAMEWKRRFMRANITIERVAPADAHVGHIGHIAYFKPRFRDSLWPRALAWIAT